ncbi:putative AMFR protein [Aspergillus novofumigatus IBT 16806]|uniref:Coupling of ubiquitin conjugation to ER degradation protein 1 n=1 Tax=Aspergillus novofumigatus (strain IBT 16806) TaxID=1392255 RepID=A0A2I1CMS3_ASPN1|nr:putative AMFR protein [Aspergillus novofumigatus IBT 16806]PKX98913.1 putative AMFR protein [Aspergillus novofumigatus IBT 16806]
MSEEEPSLNIPSLLTLAVVSFFVIRWFFKRDGSPDAGGPAPVEQIAQMFPQLSTREIMWDLQRNGGNVAATTERILSGRGLDMPPPSFQPAIVLPSTTASPAAAQPSWTSGASLKTDGQDLISRYNLSSKINGSADATSDQSSQKSTSGWSQSKEERQRLLQKRRDDMILAARRRMEQKQWQADNAST